MIRRLYGEGGGDWQTGEQIRPQKVKLPDTESETITPFSLILHSVSWRSPTNLRQKKIFLQICCLRSFNGRCQGTYWVIFKLTETGKIRTVSRYGIVFLTGPTEITVPTKTTLQQIWHFYRSPTDVTMPMWLVHSHVWWGFLYLGIYNLSDLMVILLDILSITTVCWEIKLSCLGYNLVSPPPSPGTELNLSKIITHWDFSRCNLLQISADPPIAHK